MRARAHIHKHARAKSYPTTRSLSHEVSLSLMLQQLLTQDWERGRHADRSALFLISTILVDKPNNFPPGRLGRHYDVARLLRQMPGNPWEDYREKCRELIESTHARASRSSGPSAACRWLTAIGMELPAQTEDRVAHIAMQSLIRLTLRGLTANFVLQWLARDH